MLADILVTGLLKRHGKRVAAAFALSANPLEACPNVYECEDLRLTLLSREDGKARFASVAGSIAKIIKAGLVQKEEVDVDFVQEKLICTCDYAYSSIAF